ncbi:pyruvate dehydrogenase (acetyl-transferring), homodimeric type [Actinomadura sp. CNU-125]|uniref:pyruvate dehydrogenase (acetyl-transferring), homodimeric type n=1 Tax=Actinomadura sp. CNU-125 TaxID=1904961 RepID=UPI00096862BA|nr:pyruvate dehydrogenase (acetyl-transferring), homodimeric type [Actinomadura sp. CNU-125]OLT15147.1 pyruvate dehydrogenase (acetyl-transferring), homodimeric type [Actinomadura sp. CNU-125]
MASGRQRYSIISDGLPSQLPDINPDETREWLESLDTVMKTEGRSRARYVMLRLLERARELQVGVPGLRSTDFINTIPPELEPWFPGDEHVERRIRAYIRWNAAIMVSRANRPEIGVGGHIATYASAASLYEVGFNHFFRGKDHGESGDQVFIQGHASPGIYARAFLEGRLPEEKLDGFRQEQSHPGGGLSSYPHPRLMPDFWEFPTVSMGLTAIDAVYQARFNRYLYNRRIKDTSRSHVWAFLGDGEMGEPESLGAIGLAAREELDNLTFVVNCNLQQLDGPVRGNGKIIQELESYFRGAGWNVIKVIWGRDWDPLIAQDVDGALVNKMNTTPDGQFQTFSVESGSYIREKFFGDDPRLRKIVQDLTDDDLRKLSRGGHDYRKVYAAFKSAREHVGQPTVILAHTVKGWTLGSDFEARNATHQMKKLTKAELKEFRDRLYLDIPDSALEQPLPPYYHPGEDSDEIQYMRERRAALGGFLPKRVVRAKPMKLPGDPVYAELKRGSGKQNVATTMAFVRLLKDLIKDENIGARFVPIAPDEYRTFGMDSLFPTSKIYSPHGQTYDAVDRKLLLSYKESESGQMLHEGISEAGSMASTIAAGTSYATHGEHMIPVYIFYSMFGFQRTGDQMWALGDQMGRGFLLGATAGRTTLTGEGLQHADGHSPLIAATNPACVHYDPTWSFELAYITQDALRRMYGTSEEHPNGEDVFYYLTVYNEPYQQPAEPAGVDVDGLLKGLYRYRSAPEIAAGNGQPPRAQILASGVGGRWALEAQRLLAEDWGVAADVWSATSWNGLAREARECDEHNLLHPEDEQRVPYVSRTLDNVAGPIVAVSDFARAVPDQIAPWVSGDFTSLGTDGFGFSDTRAAARRFFHVDAASIVLAVLTRLVRHGEVKPETLPQAIERYRLNVRVSDVFAGGVGSAESNTGGES